MLINRRILAPRYLLIESFFLALGYSYLTIFNTRFWKDWSYYEEKLHLKSAAIFLQITAEHQDFPVFTVFLTTTT